MTTEVTDIATLEERVARLESLLAQAQNDAARARDRGAIENLFSTYMYLHYAFEDEKIIDLWVKRWTPGIHAQYSNAGIYTTWESVTTYHRGRPDERQTLDPQPPVPYSTFDKTFEY